MQKKSKKINNYKTINIFQRSVLKTVTFTKLWTCFKWKKNSMKEQRLISQIIMSLMQYKLSVKWVFDLSLREFFFHLKQIHIFCKSHCFEHISLKSIDGFVIIFLDFFCTTVFRILLEIVWLLHFAAWMVVNGLKFLTTNGFL